jgi:hypothetical protein
VITFETSDLDDLIQVLMRRANEMVPAGMEKAKSQAEVYAAAGGRHRDPVKRRFHATSRGVRRVRHATGNQIVREAERVFYHDFVDFFGSW